VDIICFSHLRWNFVYQRPQHLLSRFARHARVFFVEEPIFDTDHSYHSIQDEKNVHVITLHLEEGLSSDEVAMKLRNMMNGLLIEYSIVNYISWYYSPTALAFSNHLSPVLTVYDCMDELSAFKFAPPALKQFEQELFDRADLVFTGGVSLYEAKKNKHHNIFPFPSSIDKEHFYVARRNSDPEPHDQLPIERPRLGFYGVVDERFNIDLLREVAEQKPFWNFIIVGPIIKIDPASLPVFDNIHYLGSKTYNQLPDYLAGWDIAIMPFALNESTRYISPTKTPEFLCGGKPVISTSIKDVVIPYGEKGLVRIADTSAEFIQAAEDLLKMKDKRAWLAKVDDYLSALSWDNTWLAMNERMDETIQIKKINHEKRQQEIHV
jgi:glycosyltransferase involved in cell wall biosynthesis